MRYELWDSETGHRVGTYPTEQAALAAVAEDVGRYGRDAEAVLTLGLLRRDPDDLVAEGRALVDRALGNPANGAVPNRLLGSVGQPNKSKPRAKPPAR
jgi:hypothetical protein